MSTFQDEKNQIMTSNVWLIHVCTSMFVCYSVDGIFVASRQSIQINVLQEFQERQSTTLYSNVFWLRKLLNEQSRQLCSGNRIMFRVVGGFVRIELIQCHSNPQCVCLIHGNNTIFQHLGDSKTLVSDPIIET